MSNESQDASTEIVETETSSKGSPEVEQTQQSPSLSLNDLGILANIINLATTRGAFKANELSAVGAAYDKLNIFLTAAQAQQAPAAESTETPSV